jgi:hypothetical protein
MRISLLRRRKPPIPQASTHSLRLRKLLAAMRQFGWIVAARRNPCHRNDPWPGARVKWQNHHPPLIAIECRIAAYPAIFGKNRSSCA